MEHVFNMCMLVVTQIFSLGQPHESSSAAIIYISTRSRGRTQPHRRRFISPSAIAFLLPVTGFLILLINCTEVKFGGEVQRRRACLNLISPLTSYVSWTSFFPPLSSQIKSHPLPVLTHTLRIPLIRIETRNPLLTWF